MTHKEMVESVRVKVQEVQDKLASYGYPKIDIHLNVMRISPGCAGTAIMSRNEVQVSVDYLREFPEDVLNVTVPHEVCHLYVRKYKPRAKQYHGPEFRYMMNLLGLEGKTYHKMMLENGPQRIKRTKVRFIYKTVQSNIEVPLTKQQHEKALSGAMFRYKNERIVFTNKKVEIK